MTKQLGLNLSLGTHGGRRNNSGRIRIHSSGVSHRKREKVKASTPLHINFKYQAYIRTNMMLNVLEKAVQNAASFGLNITHFTLQSNHVHFIAEAKNNSQLTSGMRSVVSTLNKALNKGSIQLERYHLHVLKTPREVRNALDYVLHNDVKHSGKMDKKFTKILGKGKSWLLTSSSTDIASVT